MKLDAQERCEHIQRVLDGLAALDQISGCVLLTAEGFLVSVATAGNSLDELGSLGWELTDAGVRTSATLGIGALQETYLVGERGTIMVRQVDHAHNLLVIAPGEATIGWVRVAGVRAADAIASAL